MVNCPENQLKAGTQIIFADKLQELRDEHPDLYKKLEPYMQITEEEQVLVDAEWLAEAEAADEAILRSQRQ